MSTLPPSIEALEAKSGKDWTPEERAACRAWLLSDKWDALNREVARSIPKSPADHRAGVIATFLGSPLEKVLHNYKLGYNGIWPYVRISLRYHCWRAAKALRPESRLTRAITADEEGIGLPSTSDSNPPSSLLDQELQVLLQREFSRLKPEYREPLLLYIRGATYKEIAAELGISLSLVRIRIYRGRQTLEKALNAAGLARSSEVDR